MVDTDPMVVDNIRAEEAAKGLYGVDNFCVGNTSLGSLFAKGRYGEGKDIVTNVLEKIRKLVEACESLQGVMVYHGLGGSSSGMGFEFLLNCYDSCSASWKMTCLLYPNAKCPSNPLETYNSVLCHDGVVYNSSFTLMYDNHMLSHY